MDSRYNVPSEENLANISEPQACHFKINDLMPFYYLQWKYFFSSQHQKKSDGKLNLRILLLKMKRWKYRNNCTNFFLLALYILLTELLNNELYEVSKFNKLKIQRIINHTLILL